MSRPPVHLSAQGLSTGYGSRLVIDQLDLELPGGKFTVIVGPNACGKSTLLRTLARLLRPSGGSVLLDGSDLHAIGTKALARRMGILPQSPLVPEGVTVADLVARGRQPYQSWWQQWSAEDERIVATAMELADVTELATRPADSLSGGQRQRVWIAMALAQDTDLLLLDEPTTFLDLAHQVEILDLLRRLNRGDGRTIVAVLHDLNEAARYADHLVAMRDGELIAQGPPSQILTASLVSEVFGLACAVIECPVTGNPLVIPLESDTADSPSQGAQ